MTAERTEPWNRKSAPIQVAHALQSQIAVIAAPIAKVKRRHPTLSVAVAIQTAPSDSTSQRDPKGRKCSLLIMMAGAMSVFAAEQTRTGKISDSRCGAAHKSAAEHARPQSDD